MRMLILTLSFVLFATSTAFAVGYLFRRHTVVEEQSPFRANAILSQADQAEDVGAIIVGDSITELAYLPVMCGKSVLNAGIGGAKAHQVVALLRDLLHRVKTRRVLIAIGINDAGLNYPTDIKSFRDTYRTLVSLAAATGADVTVATIAPIGSGFQFGDGHFDAALIKRFNDEIRQVAIEFHANVAEIDKDLAGKDGFLSRDFTADGIHLTKTGYQPWTRALKKSACGS